MFCITKEKNKNKKKQQKKKTKKKKKSGANPFGLGYDVISGSIHQLPVLTEATPYNPW